MTPAEKALNAVNARIERLQIILRDTHPETTQRFLFEAVLVTVGLGESLTAYIKAVGASARRRHDELKATNVALEAQHGDLLKSGQELLEQLKANPTDRAIRKQIEVAQKGMADVQKTLRRGANALQRDVAPSVAMADHLAVNVRRFTEAEQSDAVKRAVKTFVAHLHELYVAQRTLPLKATIDAEVWVKSALTEIDQATDLYDAYARAGYQAIRVIEAMSISVSDKPPQTLDEATQRANEAVTARIKEIAARFTNAG